MSIPLHSPFLSQAEWLGYLSEVQPVYGKCSKEATKSSDVWDISIPSAKSASSLLLGCVPLNSAVPRCRSAPSGQWDFVPVAFGIGKLGIRGRLRAPRTSEESRDQRGGRGCGIPVEGMRCRSANLHCWFRWLVPEIVPKALVRSLWSGS